MEQHVKCLPLVTIKQESGYVPEMKLNVLSCEMKLIISLKNFNKSSWKTSFLINLNNKYSI